MKKNSQNLRADTKASQGLAEQLEAENLIPCLAHTPKQPRKQRMTFGQGPGDAEPLREVGSFKWTGRASRTLNFGSREAHIREEFFNL